MVSTQPERLKREFDVLTSLFDRVVLQKVRQRQLAWSISHATHLGGMSEEAYVRRVTGKGKTYKKLQWRRVEYPECGVEVTAIDGNYLVITQFSLW